MEYYNLTTPQKNIWNLQKYYEDTAVGNICGAVFYQDKRDSGLLQQSVRQFVQNQSGLRLRFVDGREPRQYVADGMEDDIPVMEFQSMKHLDSYVEKFAMERIGLDDGPMYRFVVFQVEGKSGILVALSHLISDAWTYGLMANQFDRAYHKLLNNTEDELAEGDYIDYIQAEQDYMASARLKKDRTYWEGKYASRPEESFIKLHPVPVKTIRSRRITRIIPLSLEEKIAAYCKAYSVTEAVLFEAAVFVYLSKINPENDSITIGVPVLNRSGSKEKKIAGMFISTMPLTVRMEAAMTVEGLAKQITKEHMDIFRHQKYPYADIMKYLREKQGFSGNLYDVMVSYQNARTDTDAETRWYSNGASETPFVLHIDNRDGQSCHTINADYQTEVFQDETEVTCLIDRLEYIIGQIVEGHGRLIGEIDMIPAQERHKLLYEFNDTAVDYPRNKCVHELFVEQANRTPGQAALIFEDRKFTYRQLDEMSNSLAHLLREKGIKRNDVVPIIARRSWHVIVAMLGVLKAGGAYMPVDPDYPAERIEYMLEVSHSKLALLYGYGKGLSIEQFVLDDFGFMSHIEPIEQCSKPEDLCYVIFTSGSTGVPKGIGISHRNLTNFMDKNNKNEYQHYAVAHGNVTLAATVFTFDISVFEVYLSLLSGLRVVLAGDNEINQPRLITELIDKNKIDLLHCTPTRMSLCIENIEFRRKLKKIKVIMLGAEELTADLYDKISTFSDAVIFNGYGPTEITIGASFKKIRNGDDITIGRPIANTQIYILDQHRNLLPIGVAGELCIAGEGVGLGYLNRPELTAERFLPNPFATEENGHGKTMYRTGDLARFRMDGEIEYLGRIDNQVKIRGLRIELGEIESVMGSFPGIRLCAVAEQRDGNGRQYLAGYYTSAEAADEKKLRQHLLTKLPGYMVPNYFMHLDAMPMTSSGKLDRKRLPVPDLLVDAADYIAPETKAEQHLAGIWQELLQIERIGKTEDFFELGGDSLLAITMISRVEEEFQAQISVKEIMEYPVLEQLAQVIEQRKREENTDIGITACHQEKYVLLPQQKAIYAACTKSPETLAYNMPAWAKLPCKVSRQRLKECIETVINHHRSLKTYILPEDDNVYGIYDHTARVCFEEYTNETISEFLRPFDLTKAPLVHIGFTEDKLLFDMHHIIADGESLNIIIRDIWRAYAREDLSKPGIQYSDYAEYFREADYAEHKSFFREMLQCDFEPVQLPERKEPEPTDGSSKIFFLSASAAGGAKDYAKKNSLTETMLYFGAFGILLSKYTAKEDILTSIILSNRLHKEVKDVVGMFVNTLPVCLSARGNVELYFNHVKELLLALYEYQELPFLEIAKTAGMEDKSVINTSFVYQADGGKRLKIGEQELAAERMETHTAKFDLSIEITPVQDGCKVRLEYNRAKYDEKLIDSLYEAYRKILISLTALETETIEEITVLSDEEKHKLLYEFNDTAIDYPRDQCVQELFERQARRIPDQTALVFEDKQFTYRQLDEMSNSLAHYLRDCGVGRNDVVPIIARRSWHVIAAMLGVLKAGGAYMPVSPDYPKKRIADMLEIARARFALVYGYRETLPVERIDLRSFDYSGNTEPLKNRNQPEDLCYVIFTSGSTGEPKGVSSCHYNVCNYSADNGNNKVCCEVNRKKYRRIVSVTNIIFDIFVTESLLPLLNGLTVYFANEEESVNQSELSNLIQENQIEILQTTPTKMRGYLFKKEDLQYLKCLKVIILGGEAFPTDLYRELRAYTEAAIYNIYGPAETTVWSANAKVMNDDITIGRPVANTQIYILDQRQNLLPIGVAGELCIAGEGVGKGYLNRPELTAERFLPNPFAAKENGHGKILYRTGDLARFREDGEIEYLGRIDSQVKIRGLRIELGEIESVMGGFPGIRMCAVADKRDGNGRQYLVGYYTAGREIEEKELRRYLSARLPGYMAPNYFMRLNVMPMTPSGKTDRKNLPLPDFTRKFRSLHHMELGKDSYSENQAGLQSAGCGLDGTAPWTKQEKLCCHLLEEILGYGPAGVEDDFFEIGGDSLRAIEYAAKLQDRGINVLLQNIFDYPTVRGLCGFLENGAVNRIQYHAADFEKYRPLLDRNKIDAAFRPRKRSLGNILLTGATGFLGAHILDCLMKEETGKIYCLVRSAGRDEGEHRIREILRYYFDHRYEESVGERIIPISGDVKREGLAQIMPVDVGTVIHAAASVKHYGVYSYFEGVNVKGTRHALGYAKRMGARFIHISTLSVSGNSMADEFGGYRSEEVKQFAETSFYIGQPLNNVYIRSKFEAERLVLDEALRGMDAKIIRVGNLTNRASDYKFQPNYRQNAFLVRVKAALEFGLMPDYLLELYSEFSPVDLTALGVVKAAQYAGQQSIFHVYSNRPIYHDRLLEVLAQLKITMKTADQDGFAAALKNTMKSKDTEYIYEAFQNDMDDSGRLVYDTNIHIENDFTVWFLEQLGFRWNETDLEYIRGYIGYFRKLGFLKC